MTKEQKAAVFNEWAKRYAENPESFADILDEHGKPIEDYGDRCAIYFDQIAADLNIQAGQHVA